MKEKIREQFKQSVKAIVSLQEEYIGDDTINAIANNFEHFAKEYSDWKIKECLPEEPEIEASPTCCKGAFSAGFVRCKNMMLIKAGIKKDLSYKDKK